MAKDASTMGNALVAGARAVASHLSLRSTSALPNGRISKVAPKKQTANARVSSAAVGGALMALPATTHGNATQVQMFGTVAATLRFFYQCAVLRASNPGDRKAPACNMPIMTKIKEFFYRKQAWVGAAGTHTRRTNRGGGYSLRNGGRTARYI